METLISKKKTKIIHHNTISWAFSCCFVNGLNTLKYQPVRSAVLYHHTIKDDILTVSSDVIGNKYGYDNLPNSYQYFSHDLD